MPALHTRAGLKYRVFTTENNTGAHPVVGLDSPCGLDWITRGFRFKRLDLVLPLHLFRPERGAGTERLHKRKTLVLDG